MTEGRQSVQPTYFVVKVLSCQGLVHDSSVPIAVIATISGSDSSAQTSLCRAVVGGDDLVTVVYNERLLFPATLLAPGERLLLSLTSPTGTVLAKCPLEIDADTLFPALISAGIPVATTVPLFEKSSQGDVPAWHRAAATISLALGCSSDLEFDPEYGAQLATFLPSRKPSASARANSPPPFAMPPAAAASAESSSQHKSTPASQPLPPAKATVAGLGCVYGAAVTYNGRVYLHGGYRSGDVGFAAPSKRKRMLTPSFSLLSLDPHLGVWEYLPCKIRGKAPLPRAHHCAVVSDRKLVVYGGLTTTEAGRALCLGDFWALSLNDNEEREWKRMSVTVSGGDSAAPPNLCGAAAAVVGTSLYIHGGLSNDGCLSGGLHCLSLPTHNLSKIGASFPLLHSHSITPVGARGRPAVLAAAGGFTYADGRVDAPNVFVWLIDPVGRRVQKIPLGGSGAPPPAVAQYLSRTVRVPTPDGVEYEALCPPAAVVTSAGRIIVSGSKGACAVATIISEGELSWEVACVDGATVADQRIGASAVVHKSQLLILGGVHYSAVGTLPSRPGYAGAVQLAPGSSALADAGPPPLPLSSVLAFAGPRDWEKSGSNYAGSWSTIFPDVLNSSLASGIAAGDLTEKVPSVVTATPIAPSNVVSPGGQHSRDDPASLQFSDALYYGTASSPSAAKVERETQLRSLDQCRSQRREIEAQQRKAALARKPIRKAPISSRYESSPYIGSPDRKGPVVKGSKSKKLGVDSTSKTSEPSNLPISVYLNTPMPNTQQGVKSIFHSDDQLSLPAPTVPRENALSGTDKSSSLPPKSKLPQISQHVVRENHPDQLDMVAEINAALPNLASVTAKDISEAGDGGLNILQGQTAHEVLHSLLHEKYRVLHSKDAMLAAGVATAKELASYERLLDVVLADFLRRTSTASKAALVRSLAGTFEASLEALRPDRSHFTPADVSPMSYVAGVAGRSLANLGAAATPSAGGGPATFPTRSPFGISGLSPTENGILDAVGVPLPAGYTPPTLRQQASQLEKIQEVLKEQQLELEQQESNEVDRLPSVKTGLMPLQTWPVSGMVSSLATAAPGPPEVSKDRGSGTSSILQELSTMDTDADTAWQREMERLVAAAAAVSDPLALNLDELPDPSEDDDDDSFSAERPAIARKVEVTAPDTTQTNVPVSRAARMTTSHPDAVKLAAVAKGYTSDALTALSDELHQWTDPWSTTVSQIKSSTQRQERALVNQIGEDVLTNLFSNDMMAASKRSDLSQIEAVNTSAFVASKRIAREQALMAWQHDVAAQSIQAVWRGHLGRKVARTAKQEQLIVNRIAAATLIQSRWRGVLTRTRIQEVLEKRTLEENNACYAEIHAFAEAEKYMRWVNWPLPFPWYEDLADEEDRWNMLGSVSSMGPDFSLWEWWKKAKESATEEEQV